MNYKENGFRPFYHHFVALPLKESLKKVLEGFPGAAEANCILTYGYIDQQCGLTLEILAAGEIIEEHFRFAEGNNAIRSFIRISAVAEDECYYFQDEDGSLAARYAKKLDMLHSYDASEEIEKTRGMDFLDGCRDENCIDDVLVYLIKDGFEPEGCWTRIIGLGDHFFVGILLNEPDQNFDYHEGDRIAFFIREMEDGEYFCCADLNPSRKITEDDLKDGSLLEAAITAFNKERNEQHLIEVLEILRDSYVWVPCTAVMSDEDQRRMEEWVLGMKDNLDALVGQEFVAHDATRLIPDILQNGDNYFFPAFSTEKAMGEYGDNFSKIQKHMLEVIPLARSNEKKPVGIVVNAFSEPVCA